MSPHKGAFLGIDLGTTSVKVSVVDAATGEVIGQATSPDQGEIGIKSPHSGWAEQDPNDWWRHTVDAVQKATSNSTLQMVNGIGIAYQMHGLVLADESGAALRPSIIWCDSRATESGDRLSHELGDEYCETHLRNATGNLTAAKIRWVFEHEPELLQRAKAALLPGDWLAARLGASLSTTPSGLSEMVLWSFQEGQRANRAISQAAPSHELIHQVVSTFSSDGAVAIRSEELGLQSEVPITYRAGDQPNNALAVGVIRPGEAMANAGTSGVLFAVSDQVSLGMPAEVNRFLHVNGLPGTLLCLNGVGSAYSWLSKVLGRSYDELNALAAISPNGQSVPFFFPFGNGAERVLGNRNVGAGFHGIEFESAQPTELVQSLLQGICFAFKFGAQKMEAHGAKIESLKAGHANLFRCDVFGQLLADTLAVPIQLVNADGSIGAARGAGVGAGAWTLEEAAAMPQSAGGWEPQPSAILELQSKYEEWRHVLETKWCS